MKHIRKLLPAASAVAFAIVACNIGVPAPQVPGVGDAAGTVVALTLQAATQAAGRNTPAKTPQAFASPVQPTPKSSAPILTVNDPTNCRGGPGTNFQLITAFDAGTKLNILGRDKADNYWLVTIPNTQNTCWASGIYATASGDLTGLADVTPTAGAVSEVPARPGSLFFNWQGPCSSLTTILKWADVATNETGYHVYRDGNLVADLPAGSITYTDVANIPFGATITYSVEAYNNVGASPQRTISFACQ